MRCISFIKSFMQKKCSKLDLALIDCQFPQSKPFGFRNYEINGLLGKFKNAKAYAMFPMKPDKKAWFRHGYGVKKKEFKKNLEGYLTHYPENKNKIAYLPKRLQNVGVTYCCFLAQAYVLLPYLNKNKLPFVFVLYPGGAFGLNNASSDAMLAEIFKSPYFRKVIVTQPATKDYLLQKKLCSVDKIEYLFGGYLQFSLDDVKPKKKYPDDKKTLDICFVAARYSPFGMDKGYDLFIEAGKALIAKYPFVRLHVVGDFDPTDIDVSTISDKITFYGFQTPEFLKDFYPSMDICLLPNRPFKLYQGNFDGFPLGCEAMIFGSVLMTTDELDNNQGTFMDGQELIIIKPEAQDILQKIMPLIEKPEKLYQIGHKGQVKIVQVMNPVQRLDKVAHILSDEIKGGLK